MNIYNLVMDKTKDIIFLTLNVTKLDGVGNKIKELLKRKKVKNILIKKRIS